jgi:hypothetical protein
MGTALEAVQILTFAEKIRNFLIVLAVSVPGAAVLANAWHNAFITLALCVLCGGFAVIVVALHSAAHLGRECEKIGVYHFKFKRTNPLLAKQGGRRFEASYRGERSQGIFMCQGHGRVTVLIGGEPSQPT